MLGNRYNICLRPDPVDSECFCGVSDNMPLASMLSAVYGALIWIALLGGWKLARRIWSRVQR